MSTTLKFVGGCAALWMLTSMPPINNIGFVASTRRAMESTGEVSFKVARGTGRSLPAPLLLRELTSRLSRQRAFLC